MLTGDGANLSQGQRQLLSIARAAVADAPVMILDEATSSIDTRTEKLVQDGMTKLMQGRTVFVIAHRLSTVQNSKAIIVLDKGRIIERGDHNRMISMIMVMLVLSLESIRRIAEVLDEQPTVVNPENPITEISDGSIDFDDVVFKYSATADKNTLENLNLHVKSGQFVGILGSTGSGKTSLVNLISRLYDINEATK